MTTDLHAPENIGLVVFAGQSGAPIATGAVSMNAPPVGGPPGATPFRDGNPFNDFFGKKRTPDGAIILGELTAPIGGRGGGAGGDTVGHLTFPSRPFNSGILGDLRGAGGGGGGGLGILSARLIRIGPGGEIRADGGAGGGGESNNFGGGSGGNRVGAGSGGGSGGMVILQAIRVDLSSAWPNAITALGGRGGPGEDDEFDAIGAGGNGGPGLIQIHVRQPGIGLLLPRGV